MTWQVWVIGGLAVLLLLLAGYAVSLRRRLGRRPDRRLDRGPEQPSDAVEPRVTPYDPATSREHRTVGFGPTPPEVSTDPEYLITTVGGPEVPETPEDAPAAQRRVVPDAVVLSATLGEPLVKAVALAHGLRRALSPANRNRIGFEVRQEVRRSRKVRRQEMRVAWRQMKADERARAADPTTPGSTDRDDLDGLGETA